MNKFADYMKEKEGEYLVNLYKRYKEDGLLMMAKVSGLSYERLKSKLEAHHIAYFNHRSYSWTLHDDERWDDNDV